MTSTQVLSDFALALASGAVEVVDLTAPLGPETPLIKLPPQIGKNTPAIEVHAISNYDKDGPYWAWNWLKIGEHSGTHFDAPVHWISGRDYKDGITDTIPVKNFVAPVCVIDCSAETAKNPDFLLTVDGVKAWEKDARRHSGGLLGADAHRLVQAQRQRRRPSSMPTIKVRTRRVRRRRRSTIWSTKA